MKNLLMKKLENISMSMLNERLLSILSTKENVNLETLGFSEEAIQRISGDHYARLILPESAWVLCSSTRRMRMYEIDDIILSEYGTTVVGLEMLRSVNEESAEETRKEQIVQSAISTLILFRAGGDHPYL